MADISIVICTYNPDLAVLKRCLDAVSALDGAGRSIECILVDNNSSPAISGHELVKNFLRNFPFSQLIVETKPGLTHARVAGTDRCTAPVVVFFDDDNEPESGYLNGALTFMQQHPDAGVIGPGIIQVDFTDGASSLIKRFRDVYQEINMPGFRMGTDCSQYPSYYPYGTGMVVRKQIMDEYASRVKAGSLATMGRKGNVLMGGEDVQIVWLALQNGFAVGRTPDLSLVHMINKGKSNFSYLKRLAYGGGLSYLPARFEVFPEERKTVSGTYSTILTYSLKTAKISLVNFLKPRRIVLGIAWQLGYISSIYMLKNKKLPAIFRLQKRLIGV